MKVLPLVIALSGVLALTACTSASGTKTTIIDGHKVTEPMTPQDND